MTKDEFYNAIYNGRALNAQPHTFITVYDPKEVIDGNLHPTAIIDWGRYSTKQQAADLAEEFMGRWEWDCPSLIKKPDGTLISGVVADVVLDAKKDVKYITGRNKKYKGQRIPDLNSGQWYKLPSDEPRNKGMVLLGDRYRFWNIEHFGSTRFNNQSKENAIEMMLRLHGPSRRAAINSMAYSTWSLYVFEMLTDGIIKKSKLDFITELYRVYETTDMERMKTLNFWEIP
jgi:hypothetical protein